jgi:hypothetical protein
MTQTISRLYGNHGSAMAAVEELEASGFGKDAVHLVTLAPGDAEDGVLAAIVAGGVPTAHAPVYADGVRRGDTLVSVQAPFGFANTATDILDKHGPTPTDLPDHGYELPPRDPAAPLSSAWGWPVLSSDPTPLSSFLGWPTLSTRRSLPRPDAALAVDDPAPLSKKVGMQVLSDEPAPLSRRFGWRLLSDTPWPLSTRMGWSLLSKSPTPLSDRLGWRTLLHTPAPLSARMGWRVLSDDPAPLSTRFGWRVLSSDPQPGTSWFRRWMS